MKRSLLWGLTVAAILFTVAAGILFWQYHSREQTIPIYGAVPSFAFTDQTGSAFLSSRLAGRVWIGAFVFTRCQGQCPIMLQALKRIRAGSRSGHSPWIVAFTVDPLYDTPEVLAETAEALAVKSPDWRFLTGARDTIYELARRGFLLGTEATGGDRAEPILHSSRLILVDGEGQVRGYYDALDARQVERLRADAERLDHQWAP